MTASRMTGLSAHVIRIWEKRYGAVTPERTSTNRRRYSDAEIERFRLLRLATEAGHSIGNIANLSLVRLQSMVAKEMLSAGGSAPRSRAVSPARAFHDDCLAAVKRFDARGFEQAMLQAAVALGYQGLLRRVAAPLAQTIGELWRAGGATAAHEHFLAAALRVFLGRLSGQFALSANAPRIIIATPAGQLHELGAVIVEAAAAQIGWHTTYLGASLPAAEIAGAAVQNHALAVALSIVYPDDDPDLPQELVNLRHLLPPETRIHIGGRAASAYLKTIKRIKASFTESIAEFCDQLDELRRRSQKKEARRADK